MLEGGRDSTHFVIIFAVEVDCSLAENVEMGLRGYTFFDGGRREADRDARCAEGERGCSMDAPERKGTVVSTRVILPALSIGLYLSWWGLCHDEMLYIAFSIEMVQSCMSSFAGVLAAGAILSATWNRQWWRSGRFFAGVVGCQLVVFACFGGSLLVELTPAIIACEPFVSITVFFALFMVVRSVADASLSELVGILSGSLVAYGCVVGMFWAITTMAPGSLARVALYGCVCVAAAICTYAALRRFRFMRADAKCGSKEKDSELVRPLDSECIHVPFPLAVHVVSYALVFGFTHSLSGRVVPSVPEKVFLVSLE